MDIMTDYFGRDASELNDKKLWLLDMDGTIYNEDVLIEGTLDFLDRVIETGGKYVFITNNSSRSLCDYVKKVQRLGIKADESNFFTSGQATCMMLNKDYPGAKVYCQGTKSLVSELTDSGINVTEKVEDDIDVILVGFDTELTSEKLNNTSKLLITRDLPYFATNCDLRCPVNFGYIPDCGSICQMLENTTGKSPVFIGKPKPDMVYKAMERYGYEENQTVVIGDRIYTDIPAGVNAGVCTICVLSGEATLDDIKNYEVKPDLVFKSIKEVWQIIK